MLIISKKYKFFVEGECEKKLINTLKEQKTLIVSGTVSVFNVIQDELNPTILRTITKDTVAVFVFDTDVEKLDVLKKNIDLIKNHPNAKDVICVLQIKNLEDELVRSTDVRAVKDLTHSSTKEFKHAFITDKNLYGKLEKHHFNMSKFWSTNPRGAFSNIENQGYLIKK